MTLLVRYRKHTEKITAFILNEDEDGDGAQVTGAKRYMMDIEQVTQFRKELEIIHDDLSARALNCFHESTCKWIQPTEMQSSSTITLRTKLQYSSLWTFQLQTTILLFFDICRRVLRIALNESSTSYSPSNFGPIQIFVYVYCDILESGKKSRDMESWLKCITSDSY